MTDADPARRSLPCSPLVGASADGLAVRLVRRTAPAAGGNGGTFVVLHEGRCSRVLLAELVAADSGAATRFAWKIRSDAPGPSGGADAPVANADLDRMWLRERSELARVRSPHVVAAVAVPATLNSSPPVWHCQRVDRFFHPVSPATGARLRTCRDDALLARCGLPAYAVASERFVHDSGPAGAPVLYRQHGEAAQLAGGGELHTAHDLVRSFARLVHAPAGDAAANAAAADLPCIGCVHRATCYPVGATGDLPATRELRVVSFHDVDGVALAPHDFDFAEAIALLGGADVAEVLAARAAGGRGAVSATTLTALERAGSPFVADVGRRAAEALQQKLGLFLDVCAGVAAVHAAGRPHLALAPSNVLVVAGDAASAPVRTQLRARVTDLASAAPVAGDWLEPGFDVRGDAKARAYVAPALLAAAGGDGRERSLPVACWRTGAADGKVRLVVEVQNEAPPRAFAAGDLVLVQPVAGGPTLVAEIAEMRARGLVASALLPADAACLAWDGQQFAARVSFRRRLGPGADLHGLGMLLLHTLVVDDAQGIDDVAAAFAQCLRRLEEAPSSLRVVERELSATCVQLLLAKDQRDRFAPLHVLHRARERQALADAERLGRPAFDPAIWQRLLVVAARAVAGWAPFAYDNAGGGTDGLAAMVADVKVLRRRLDIDVSHAAVRDAAVVAACVEFAERLRARTGSGAVVAPPGCRLLLRRDGDAQVQDLRFDLERVTVGRRDGENVLRLQDPMVSSLHAVLEHTAEGWVVTDRNSTNGTEVDGIRLPVDVPQPLQDGSVIVIRPFQLTFRALAPAAADPADTRGRTTAQLLDRLHDAFARDGDAGSVRAHEAMLAALADASRELPPTVLATQLDELVGASGGGDSVGGAPAVNQAGLEAVAARALQQLSRSLLGPSEFRTAEQVQTFVGKLGRFVDTTAHWIERMLDLKRGLGQHLDLGLASTAAGKPSARTAADVRMLAAGWGEGSPPADASAWYVAKFFDDVLQIVIGLLRGNQQVRKALRERLDPARLVALAGQELTLRKAVQGAASSALWQLYVQTFAEVTGGPAGGDELERLIDRAAAELASRQ